MTMQPPSVPAPPTVTVTVTVPAPPPGLGGQPIRVDNVTDWVDILTLVVGSVSAVGAAGALLIAALVYRRQVDDARRQQASGISLEIEPPPASYRSLLLPEAPWTAPEIVRHEITVKNNSRNDVFDVVVDSKYTASDYGGDLFERFRDGPHDKSRIHLGDSLGAGGELDLVVTDVWIHRVEVSFSDASGRRWKRNNIGQLSEIRPVRSRARKSNKPKSAASD